MDANQVQPKSGKPQEVLVDNGPGVEETDALMADVIAEVESEWEDADLAALPDSAESSDESLEAPGEENGEAVEAGEGEPEPVEEDGDEDDRSIQRLVAREVELRQKEEKIAQREQHVSRLEQENQQLRQAYEEMNSRIPADFMEDLRGQPRKALEAAGYDPDHLVRVILAEKLQAQGKEVPKELRDEIRAADQEYRYKKQEQKIAQLEQDRKGREFVAKVESEARQYIKGMTELKPEFSKHAPTVAKVAKADPERVYAEIMDEISRDANARRREPNAQLISYAEASKRVEARWAQMAKLLGGAVPKDDASTTADEKTGTKSATGASNKKPIVKLPGARPVAKTQAQLEEEGLQEALAEYKRVETARRKNLAPLRNK